MSDPCANLYFNPFISGVFNFLPTLGRIARPRRAIISVISPLPYRTRAGRIKTTISRFERGNTKFQLNLWKKIHFQTEKFIKKHQNKPWMQKDTLFIEYWVLQRISGCLTLQHFVSYGGE
jgi:hypothetical protein